MAPIVHYSYEGDLMNAVGIDVSKGKSTVAVIRPFGEIVRTPFDVNHTQKELSELANYILSLDGETRVVMESTGKYSDPVVKVLSETGIFVCAVNAKLIHDYGGGGNTIRKDRTDNIDSLKIAGFCLDKWARLEPYSPVDEMRKTLKTFNRQHDEYMKIKVMLKNNLISLSDQVFPGVNDLFTSNARDKDGHEKWIDFLGLFWHCECITPLSESVFSARYQKWCKKNSYHFNSDKAREIYESAKNVQPTIPKNDYTKNLILQAVSQINSICETIANLKIEMNKIAKTLPEYEVVISMHGVGDVLAPQLMAEIGDIRRYPRRSSLARFAGIEPPESQSGVYNQRSRRISKQGSPHLRKTLFQVMRCVLQKKNINEATFQFIDRKRSEGKPFKVYMIAGANKFLRIYYARVKEFIDTLDASLETSSISA
jgi:transposase